MSLCAFRGNVTSLCCPTNRPWSLVPAFLLLLVVSSSNMNSVIHTRAFDSVSFSFHITLLFLQLFVVQSHANFQVHLSPTLYCSNFDQTILEVVVSSQYLLLNRFLTHSQVDRLGT